MAITRDNLIKEIRREIASKGGASTLKKYGKRHFSDLAKRRWAKKRAVDKVAI